jgi:HEAT repeat protein
VRLLFTESYRSPRGQSPNSCGCPTTNATTSRNWATFGLGSHLGCKGDPQLVDTLDVREALAKRLEDPHAETRAEATLGLAIRGDERAIPVVIRELRAGAEWTHYVEAAELLADPRLYDALCEAKATNRTADLTDAMAACDPNAARQP